jgi:hypothetical protein
VNPASITSENASIANGLGWWTSPDPKGISLRHLLNPQKLNKCSYVLNNPTGAFDPDGEEELTMQFRALIQKESVGGFKGDNRGFSADPKASSRVSVTVRIETDPAKNHDNPMIGKPQIDIGKTHPDHWRREIIQWSKNARGECDSGQEWKRDCKYSG